MDSALVGSGGFFTTGRGAGRAGADFVTSPEVGVLFGAVVARALDGWWRELGSPDPFVVIEVGAGRGRLATDVLRAEPECAGALRYVLVEISPALRDAQRELLAIEPVADVLGPALGDPDDDADEPLRPVPGLGPLVASVEELPDSSWPGVVIANELLDNLPVDLVERRSDGWDEVRVGLVESSEGGGGHFVEVVVPAAPALVEAADSLAGGVDVPAGARLPVPVGAVAWLGNAARAIPSGFVTVVDYMADVGELLERGPVGWLRTYRDHDRGGSPLDDPGSGDITCDVPLDALLAEASRAGLTVDSVTPQAEWLRDLGVDDLVAEARRTYEATRAEGGLDSLAARSRVHEADALCDPAGLGAHRVVVLRR